MLTRLAFIWTAPLTLQCAIAAIGIAATQSSLADESLYALATGELKGYCIAEVCLGATIDEVSLQGKVSFSPLVLPDGKLTCSDIGNLAFGDLITKDGRAFEVSFALVSAAGTVKSRYRLTGVKMKLPVISELQIDHLRQTLTTRYGLQQLEGADLPNQWFGRTTSGRFSISVMKWWARPDVPPDVFTRVKGLSLDARYGRQKEWLMTQPECRSGLPKV
jgi:hypothetical protein